MNDPRFVVTGTPDADAVLAIVALAGLVAQSAIPPGFAETVNQHDCNPIGLDLASQPHGFVLLAFNQTRLPSRTEGFYEGVSRMTSLLNTGLSQEKQKHTLRVEEARKRRAREALVALYDPDGHEISTTEGAHTHNADKTRVVLVQGNVWGFDVWYQWASVVVSYSSRLEKITLGCPDLETSEEIFGDGGLFRVYQSFGEGWGGRETVGGSPRGQKKTLDDARQIAQRIARLITPAQ